jgi:hypothetical protein
MSSAAFSDGKLGRKHFINLSFFFTIPRLTGIMQDVKGVVDKK